MAGDDRREDGGDSLPGMDPLSLDEALAVVGESTRAAILRELGDAQGEGGPAATVLGFSELMDRAGVEDSGRFNYHLEKLVGTFVAKTDAGYRLLLPGQLVYQSMVAGTLTERPAVDAFPAGPCPDCGGDLVGTYRPDHVLAVRCPGCDRLVDAVHLPARAAENRSPPELLDAAYQRRHQAVGAMRRGICFGCGGRVERRIEPAGIDAVDCDPGPQAVLACQACHASVVGNPAHVALTAPAVAGFFADHDRDPALARYWNDPLVTARAGVELVGEDPPRVAIPFEIDCDRLRVVLDDDLQVARFERTGV